MAYTATHTRALATVARKGAAVTCSHFSPGSFDPTTGISTDPVTTTVTGSAIQDRPNLDSYVALSLTVTSARTLFFVPDTKGSLPALGDTLTWESLPYSVKSIDPLNPDGAGAIAATLIVSG